MAEVTDASGFGMIALVKFAGTNFSGV